VDDSGPTFPSWVIALIVISACTKKKLTPESDRSTNAALGGFNFSFYLIIRTNEARGGTNAELKANLLDIHNQRLRFMDENNVDYVRCPVFFWLAIIF